MFEVLESLPSGQRKVISELLLSDRAVAVDFSNVAEYFFVRNDKEYWDLSAGDFPQCVPPWRASWIEWRTPGEINSTEFGHQTETVRYWACKATDLRIKNDASRSPVDFERIRAEYQSWGRARPPNNLGSETTRLQYIVEMGAALPGCDRVVQMEFFLRNANTSVCPASPFVGRQVVFLDARGEYIPTGEVLGDCASHPRHRKEVEKMVSGRARPVALLGFSLSNCSNSELVDGRLSRGKRRSWERRGMDVGRVVYKTVSIAPVGRNRSPGEGACTGSEKKLHICRGHFKDYREKGLFGQHKGVYWWDAHMRGSEEAGRVHKTYEVATP